MNRRFALHALIVVGILLAAVPAFAAKGGNGGGGNESYPGTLVATPQVLRAGDTFTVHGCGYDAKLGDVMVSFAGGGWGSPLDAYGCFTIAGIPALSGDTMPAGTYEVAALQQVRGRWVETGETKVTVQ